ncbi:hypothetical protein LguiA_019347 [Lonicera macranthoides]
MDMEVDKSHEGCRKGAEAVLNLQPNSSVSITYHPLFGPHDDLVLLELDEKLLPDVLHQRVSLRGQPDEDAVLCTPSKTYAVKFVGNSNSVFLIPPSDQSAFQENSHDCDEQDNEKAGISSVIKVAPGNMELVEVAPKLDKLKLLLLENPYKFDEAIEMTELDSSLYTWDDLVNRVQASDAELMSALEAFSAAEINGYWRIVDDKYMDMILNMLLHNSVLNEWSFDALIEDEVVSVLESDGFPCKLARHCLQVFASRVGPGGSGSCVWRLDEKRVCVHFARGILRGGKMKMERFMEEWAQKVPDKMQVNFDMLEGEVLTENLGIQSWVYPFSVSSLPSAPAERFSMLFKERAKWEWKDLQPYIRDLSVPGLTAEGLLLKYTRRTQPTADAEPVFSAR